MISKGTVLRNKICPTMIGKVKKLCGNGMALIEINDKHLDMKEMAICLENWDEVKPSITKPQAQEFYRDLCGTVYGNANKNCQGIMNIPMIAQHMGISNERAEEYCNAMIKYGITEKQSGMIVV